MRIRLLTITHKSPAWINAGFEDYNKRLPLSQQLELIEIPAEKRTHYADVDRLKEREGEKILSLIKPHHHVIALDVNGKQFPTLTLAKKITEWQQIGSTIDLLVGGPDGLSNACLTKANERWSLSLLTFPHFLVRVLLAEQFYRAYTILQNHPYHR